MVNPGATLKGRRLHLRPLEASDAEALFRLVEQSHDILKRRLRWVGEVHSTDDEERFIDRVGISQADTVWAMVENRSRRLVGIASLREVPRRERSQGRLSLWVSGEKQDKGYGSEAGRLALDYAFRRGGMHRVSARLDPANRSYRRVLKKIGFKYEGCLRSDKRLNGRWVDQECWGLLKSEWKK